MKVEVHTLTVALGFLRDGHHGDLSRGHPEGPLTGQMLDQDGHKTLYGTENSSVDGNRSPETGLEGLLMPHKVLIVTLVSLKQLRGHLLARLGFLVLCSIFLFFGGLLTLVLEVEADGQLEVTLDSSALVGAVHRIEHLDVDLGAVEGTVTSVDRPLMSRPVQGLFQGGLRLVPKGIVTEASLRSGGEFVLNPETEVAINVVQEIQHSHDLLHHLVFAAEDVCVVLLETADAGEAGEGS